MTPISHPHVRFAARLEEARASVRPLLDLTETDPSRCKLGFSSAEIEAILNERGTASGAASRGLVDAREAVSSYLAGRGASVPPERVFLTSSASEARRLLFELVCPPGHEVLVACPSRTFLDELAASRSVRLRKYALEYDGEWRVDRRSIRNAIGRQTRALVLGNPSAPTGALASREALAEIEELCSTHGIALIGDEEFADTAQSPCPSVAETQEGLTLHTAGLRGVCGVAPIDAHWIAVAGQDELVAPAVSRLEQLERGAAPPPWLPVAIPALLARREQFLGPLRARLAQNRAALATASLREAPWTLQWGGGGWWAVLQLGAAEDEESLCLDLIDDGVALEPGFLHGFPRDGYVVVSLLPTPETFGEALSRLEQRLRAPLGPHSR